MVFHIFADQGKYQSTLGLVSTYSSSYVSSLSYWTMNFIVGLSLYAGCNAIYTYMNKLNKLVKTIPYMVGDGDISAPETVELFFDRAFCSHGQP